MKKFYNIFSRSRLNSLILLLSLGCFCLSSLNSCSASEEPDSNEIEVPEGMELITLMIPDYDGGSAKFGSRAFDTEEEGYMSNLYVIAIKYCETKDTPENMEEEDFQKKVYTFALNPVGRIFQVGEKRYHTFNITLYPGKYKFGVIANADLYLSRQKQISGFTKEEDLASIVLNFKEDTPLAPLHLPMVCMPPDIRYQTKTVSENEDGTTKTVYSEEFKGVTEHNLITIGNGENNVICAEMKFLCSKVRYTILFDKTPGGISEAFGNSWIRFNVDDQLKPTAHNIRKHTELEIGKGFPDGETNYATEDLFITSSDNITRASWNISIDRFYWNEEGVNYPKSPESKLDIWDKSTEEWIPLLQKVWQGVVYLPENNTGDGSNNTYLEFPCHFRANSLDETPEKEGTPKKIYLFGNPGESKFEGTVQEGQNKGDYTNVEGTFTGLERNYFYDVVALVRNPEDISDLDIRVFVSILPWHETDQNLDDDWLYN